MSVYIGGWRAGARRTIARAMEGQPADLHWTARRTILRAKAHDYHGGTSWGRKIWGQEVRRYLEQHGMPPRPALGTPLVGNRQQSKQASKLTAPDITFPFRQNQ